MSDSDSKERIDEKEGARHIEDASRDDSAEGLAQEIDPVEEKKLVRKLDLSLPPLFLIIYCMNFIDRTAIGNAKIAGIEKDLGMVGFDYNIALTIFYVCFIVADIPSNLALKHFGSIWLAGLVLSFGIVALSTAFVKSYAGLIATRVFLGLAEGGTLSGLTYIMSRYYRRTELVMRIGAFFGVAPPLAGGFGGLLASGLLSVPDFGVVKTWRKIFLIEGIITTGFGLLCFFIIPDDPSISRFLTPSERRLALLRIAADHPERRTAEKEKTNWRLIWRSFSITTLVCAMCYLFINISFQGLSLFLPTVVATLGHFTVVESQLRTVPPYMVAVVNALTGAFISMRLRKRALVIASNITIMIIGYSIFVGSHNNHARYGACFLTIAGGSVAGPMILAWGTDNAAPDTVRAVATGAIPGIGTLGAVIAVWTYLPTDAPDFHQGNSLVLATTITALVLVLSLALYVYKENQFRERGGRDYRLEGATEKDIDEMGYRHPNFRYQI